MERFYEIYDLPPGPDREHSNTKQRSQPYSNGGFNMCSSDEANEFSNNYSNKRRSWTDMLENQTCVSDISSFNSSYSTVIPTGKPNEIINGKRRSWDKLMESDENLKRHDNLVQVSILPEPLRPISLMMVKDGRLGKVHLYNKKPRKVKNPSTSSKTSTVSEFILVPQQMSMENVAEMLNNETNDNRSYDKLDGNDKNTMRYWSARKTTFAIIATLGLCIFVGLVGYFIRKMLESQNNYSLNIYNAKDSQSYSLNVFIAKSTAILVMNNSLSVTQTKTFVDFNNKLMVQQNGTLSNHCFVQKLNESNLPNKEIVKAAVSLSSKEIRTVEWSQDWNWQVNVADIKMIDAVHSDEEMKAFCGISNNIFMITKNSASQQNLQCNECFPLCLPEYGLIRVSDKDWILTVLSEKCFWFSSLGVPQLTPQTTLVPLQKYFSNNNFMPQQQWQSQQPSSQFVQSPFNFNQGNQQMPSWSSPNGAFWFNRRNFRR